MNTSHWPRTTTRVVDQVLPWVERSGLVILLAMPLMIFLGIAICDIAIIAIASLFVLRSALLRDFAWLQTRWVQLGLLLWAYLIVISPYATMNAKLSFQQALPFGRFVFFAAGLQFWLLKNADYRQYLLYTLGGALLFISVDIIFTFLTGLSLVGKSSVQYAHYNQITWIWHRNYTRVVGLNGKMNNGTLLAWAGMPFMVYLLMTVLKRRSLSTTVLSTLSILIISLAILVSGERMALLELGLGYVLTFIFIRPLRKLLFIVCLLVAAIAFFVLWHNPGLWQRNVTLVLSAISQISTNDYGRIFKASMAIFLDHPLFGIGLKQYYLISFLPQYVPFNAINSHVQNVYLEFLTGTGLVGTLLFLSLMYCWFKQFWQGRHDIKAAPIAMAVWIALIIRIWPFASTTSFFFAWGGVTFWWMGAWLLALTEEKKDA